MRKALSVLNIYEEASGLKINLTKTKAIWIGSKRFSDEKICHEVKLDWVRSFTALGIKYDVTNLQEIVELNCIPKTAEIDKILLNWSRRNTTLAGRILVVKNLALSKLVHFFISLPSPPKNFMREINKKFYSFIWKGKPPKIKRRTLEANIEQGGLKMVNVERFEQTLKVKWLKKILQSPETWTDVPLKYEIDKICRYGQDYAKNILQTIKNPFWSSMIIATASFQQKLNELYPNNNVLEEPIWFNPNLKIPFIRKWDNKGLRKIGDLFNDLGRIKSREQLMKDFNLTINFIDFTRISRAIPQNYLLKILEVGEKETAPWCQQFVSTILSDNKNNQNIKKTILSDQGSIPTARLKWEEILLTPGDDLFWNKIFKIPSICLQDMWMRMFQYKILHRILPTNKKLLQFKIKDSSDCEYCGQEEESLLHLFCECDLSTQIWQELVDWLGKQGQKINYLTDSQILLGDPSLDPVINRIIITTKVSIFKNKGGNPPNLIQIVNSLKKQFKTERFTAKCNNKERFFRGFWSPIWGKVCDE